MLKRGLHRAIVYRQSEWIRFLDRRSPQKSTTAKQTTRTATVPPPKEFKHIIIDIFLKVHPSPYMLHGVHSAQGLFNFTTLRAPHQTVTAELIFRKRATTALARRVLLCTVES